MCSQISFFSPPYPPFLPPPPPPSPSLPPSLPSSLPPFLPSSLPPSVVSFLLPPPPPLPLPPSSPLQFLPSSPSIPYLFECSNIISLPPSPLPSSSPFIVLILIENPKLLPQTSFGTIPMNSGFLPSKALFLFLDKSPVVSLPPW